MAMFLVDNDKYILFQHFDVSYLEKCSPHNFLTTQELIAVDDDPGDVAEEKNDDYTDQDRDKVQVLLRRTSRPLSREPESFSIC